LKVDASGLKRLKLMFFFWETFRPASLIAMGTCDYSLLRIIFGDGNGISLEVAYRILVKETLL